MFNRKYTRVLLARLGLRLFGGRPYAPKCSTLILGFHKTSINFC